MPRSVRSAARMSWERGRTTDLGAKGHMANLLVFGRQNQRRNISVVRVPTPATRVGKPPRDATPGGRRPPSAALPLFAQRVDEAAAGQSLEGSLLKEMDAPARRPRPRRGSLHLWGAPSRATTPN